MDKYDEVALDICRYLDHRKDADRDLGIANILRTSFPAEASGGLREIAEALWDIPHRRDTSYPKDLDDIVAILASRPAPSAEKALREALEEYAATWKPGTSIREKLDRILALAHEAPKEAER